MDFGGCKGSNTLKKVDNDADQMETSLDSNGPLTDEQKNTIVTEWAAEGKPTLLALIQ